MIFTFLRNEHTISGNWASTLRFGVFLWLVRHCFCSVFAGYFGLLFESSQRVHSLSSGRDSFVSLSLRSKERILEVLNMAQPCAMDSYNDTLCLNFYRAYSRDVIKFLNPKLKSHQSFYPHQA